MGYAIGSLAGYTAGVQMVEMDLFKNSLSYAAKGSSAIMAPNMSSGTNYMLPVADKAENTALVLYRNPNLLTTPVVYNRALVTAPLQNNFLPYNPNLALPVKYPIVTESGVTLYQGYAIGIRGGTYEEAGITKDSKIAYRNNGSYYVVGEGKDGFKNIPATDVTTNYLVSASGGRKGNPTTRKEITDLVPILDKFNFKVTAGGTLPEEYMEPLNQVERNKKTTKGANYIDLTAIGWINEREVKLRINTVDIYKNGNLTNREANAEKAINLKIKEEGEKNPPILTIPKGEKLENSEKKIEKVIENIKVEAEKNKKIKKNEKEKK